MYRWIYHTMMLWVITKSLRNLRFKIGMNFPKNAIEELLNYLGILRNETPKLVLTSFGLPQFFMLRFLTPLLKFLVRCFPKWCSKPLLPVGRPQEPNLTGKCDELASPKVLRVYPPNRLHNTTTMQPQNWRFGWKMIFPFQRKFDL